jgi:hypothetical protein
MKTKLFTLALLLMSAASFAQKAFDDWEKNGKVQEVTVTRENWLIRINGNSAFAVFDQHNKRPDGTNRHSMVERYLERTNGEWKLVNVTVLAGK